MKYKARSGLFRAQTGAGMQAFSPNATRKQRLTKLQKELFAQAVRKARKIASEKARKAKI